MIGSALDRHGPDRSRRFLDDTRWKKGSRLSDLLMFAGPDVIGDVDDALRRLRDTRAAGPSAATGPPT